MGGRRVHHRLSAFLIWSGVGDAINESKWRAGSVAQMALSVVMNLRQNLPGAVPVPARRGGAVWRKEARLAAESVGRVLFPDWSRMRHIIFSNQNELGMSRIYDLGVEGVNIGVILRGGTATTSL